MVLITALEAIVRALLGVKSTGYMCGLLFAVSLMCLIDRHLVRCDNTMILKYLIYLHLYYAKHLLMMFWLLNLLVLAFITLQIITNRINTGESIFFSWF